MKTIEGIKLTGKSKCIIKWNSEYSNNVMVGYKPLISLVWTVNDESIKNNNIIVMDSW